MSHPSRITLERHSVDDLPEPARAEVEGHVAACASCRAYLDELRAAAAAHRAAPPEPFVARVRARRSAEARRARRIGAGMALGGAVAAAVALLVIRPGAAPPRPPGDLALKGGGIAVHRKRGAAMAPLGERDRVRAGDALQVVVTLARPGRVSAWMVDDTGRIDELAARLALPAGGAPLPDALEVEAPCRDSVLVVATGEAADRWTAADVRGAPSLAPGGAGPTPAGLLAIAISCER